MAARVSLRGGEKISRAAAGEGNEREPLPGEGGRPLFKARGEEAESCGELPVRLGYVLFPERSH